MEEFDLPDPGEGIAEADLVEWLVEPGDTVEADDPVANVETDKAVVEIPVPEAGTIEELLWDEGDTATVGEPFLRYTTGGDEDVSQTSTSGDQEERPERAEPRQRNDPRHEEKTSTDGVKAMPRVRHRAKELDVDLQGVDGTGPHGRILIDDLPGHEAAEDNPWEEHGEHHHSRTEQEEPQPEEEVIEQFNPEHHEFSGPPRSRGKAKDAEHVQRTEKHEKLNVLDGTRRVIAEQMRHSQATTAQTTITEEADVTELVNVHDELKPHLDAPITYLAYFTKAATQILNEHPELNATLTEDKHVVHDDQHIGIAVDTDRGLLVPVIDDADEQSVAELANSIADVAAQARNKDGSPSLYDGSTFTISSIGSIGGETFTPILNTPEVAILGIGQIKERPRYHGDDLVKAKVVQLSLTVDHQVIDGADATRFLVDLKERLEEPEEMLVKG